MHEIKQRIDVIGKVLTNEYKLPVQPAIEFCYLQVRYICELIALACLAAHGDHPEYKTLRMVSAVKADWILNALEKLNPEFFPQPGVPLTHSDGGMEFTPYADVGLSKDDLLRLYRKCGDNLHRGPFKAMGDEWPEPDFSIIEAAVPAIAALLSFHRIQLLTPDEELWVQMVGPNEGRVHARLVAPIQDDLTQT